MEIVGQKRSLFRLGTLPSITCSFALTFTEKEALVRNQGLDSAFTRISFFFSLITGCVEGSETGHLDGNNSLSFFATCWGAESIEYIPRNMTSLNICFVHIAIVDMMVLFNAAVNPFVYTLMSHQFRQKIRGVICCQSASVAPKPKLLRKIRV